MGDMRAAWGDGFQFLGSKAIHAFLIFVFPMRRTEERRMRKRLMAL
jgi:hypothetical protein